MIGAMLKSHFADPGHILYPRFDKDGTWESPHRVIVSEGTFVDRVEAVAEAKRGFVTPLEPLSKIFTTNEVALLLEKRKQISNKTGERTTVFASYENPWGSSGGILAVARAAVTALEKRGERAIRISPHHSKLRDALDVSKLTPEVVCDVPLGDSSVQVKVYKVEDKNKAYGSWYLISAPGYFDLDGGAFRSEPYFDSNESAEERDGDKSRVLKDSLFFCKAVPHVLKALGYTKDVIVEAQDWQCAFLAQTVLEAQIGEKPVLNTAATYAMLHNAYDHWLPSHVLSRFTNRTGSSGETVLQRMLELTAGPIATVSNGFAVGLKQSPLQRHYYAPHLLDIFERHGLIGITNGSLAALDKPFDSYAYTRAYQGDTSLLIAQKILARAAALKALSEHIAQPSRNSIGTLMGGTVSYVSGDITNLKQSVPIFVCYGRFDLGQKGVDVFVDAIRRMPKGLGRYILISWPGSTEDYVQKHFECYEKLAEERKGEFIFFPERRPEFGALMKGASWVVYPSLYEPFGSMADCLVNTTGAVFNAIDGLAQQGLVPSRKLYIPDGELQTSYAEPLMPLVPYHEGRADMSDDRLRDEIVSLQGLTFPMERFQHRLFQLKSEALMLALTKACAVYSADDGAGYYRGLAEVSDIPQSWVVNSEQRVAWYESLPS